MGILHETGHGLYEQGLPKEWSHWPVARRAAWRSTKARACSSEMQIVRTAEFWEWAMPLAQQHLGTDAIAGWDLDDMLAHVHHDRARPDPRRCRRGDLSAARHPALRDRAGPDRRARLRPRTCRKSGTPRCSEYLGLSTIDNPKDGPMQDVHWPVRRLRLFPELHAGRHDRRAAMGGRSSGTIPAAATTSATAISPASTTGAATTSGRRPRRCRRRT